MQPFEKGPIHNAFAVPVKGEIVLEAISQEPPPDISETIPPYLDSNESWIHGYWTWIPSQNDFVWVSGVWRLPPPQKIWIDGLWLKLEEGWVWVHGFWSPELTEYTYIQDAPPAPIEEDAGLPPGEDYFWNPGYWSYSNSTKQYQWISGSWEELDFNWVLVPAHYVWRPEGYLFIPAYWDWPVEQRGRAYASLALSPEERISEMAVSPSIEIEPMIVLQAAAEYYPNYIYIIQHHHHYHPDFWEGWAPIWWTWPRWWCLPWHDHWGLWWWYIHPGYPQPLWLTPALARLIPPPSPHLLGLTNRLNPPAIVTPHGVVRGDALIRAAGRHGDRPIVSEKKLKEIQERALPKRAVSNILKPEGDRKSRQDRLPLRDHPQLPKQLVPKERVPKAAPAALPRKPGSGIPKKETLPAIPEQKKPEIKNAGPPSVQERRGPQIISPPKSSYEKKQLSPQTVPTPEMDRIQTTPVLPEVPEKPLITRPPVIPAETRPQTPPGSGNIRPNTPHIPFIRPYRPYPQSLPPESPQTGQVRPNVPRIPQELPLGPMPSGYPITTFPGQPIDPYMGPRTIIIPRDSGFPPYGPQVIPQQRLLPAYPQQIRRLHVVPQVHVVPQAQPLPQPIPRQVRAAPVQPQRSPQAVQRLPQIRQEVQQSRPTSQAVNPASQQPRQVQTDMKKRKER